MAGRRFWRSQWRRPKRRRWAAPPPHPSTQIWLAPLPPSFPSRLLTTGRRARPRPPMVLMAGGEVKSRKRRSSPSGLRRVFMLVSSDGIICSSSSKRAALKGLSIFTSCHLTYSPLSHGSACVLDRYC